VTSDSSVDSATLMKRSLVELRKLRARIHELESTHKEPIAIIGLGCRFPGGAHTPDAFWQLLVSGRDAIRETPASRWDLSAFYDPDPTAPGKTYTKNGGFLDEVDLFDPEFFGISHREAISLDPQQRMLLEVTWEALEYASQAPDRLYGTGAGVFIGISGFEYAAHLVRSVDLTAIDPYFGTGTALSAAAGRLSFTLGLTGPSVAVDTACSSSLVALHLACQSLRNRECDLALAGSANLMVAPEVNIAFSKAQLLAPDGRCKTFDIAADGYGRGEGCGVVVLKRLSDALANGDRIEALIRGSAVNQDGPSGALVVPNGLSQQAVIRKALENAGVSTGDIDYVEAHGTGTALGDPIEVGALGHVFGNHRDRNPPLIIGSVKTNLGHLESAAGIAGLIKVALSLKREIIPPHLHFHKPNPRIPWDLLPAVIPTEPMPWPRGSRRRFAGLSSFGFTGTNAHVILEEAHMPEEVERCSDRPVHALTLSARTDEALRDMAANFGRHLSSNSDIAPGDLCFSANTGRSRFGRRMAIVANSVDEFSERLTDFGSGRESSGVFRSSQGASKTKIGFLFTDRGAEYPEMGRELGKTNAVFRETLNRCDQILGSRIDQSLLAAMLETDGAPVDDALTDLTLFALEISLARTWQSWGVQPAAVVGQGLGEYAAACMSGVFSLEDGLELVAHRSDSNAAAVLSRLRWSAPRIQMASSLTGDIVLNEVTAPAYWAGVARQTSRVADAIRSLRRLGCNCFIEIGPEPTLIRLGREVLPEDDINWIYSLRKGEPDWQGFVKGLAFLSTQDVNVDWLAFDREYKRRRIPLPTYPFQRKRFWPQPAHHETSVSPDLYYRVDWQPQVSAGDNVSGPDSSGSWLLLADGSGIGRSLATKLQESGIECVLAFAGTEYRRTGMSECIIDPENAEHFKRLLAEMFEGRPQLDATVHLWGLDGSASDSTEPDQLQAATLKGCGGALHLVQALALNKPTGPYKLWFVTRGALRVGSEIDLPGVVQASLWGLSGVIAVELPQIHCTSIDLDPSRSQGDAGALFDEIRRPDATVGDNIALRGGRRYVRRLVHSMPPEPASVGLKPDRTYLIAGGLGGIGLRLARWMAEMGAGNLVLLSRAEPSHEARLAVDEVRRMGTDIAVLRADVSRVDDVAAAFQQIRASLRPLAGVINCAGVSNDRMLLRNEWDLFTEVLAPKVNGSWNLHYLTRELQLDFFVLFSSSASLLPVPGMASYAAANAFQDALAHYRECHGLPALSISWGPWEDVGMTQRAGRSRQDQWRANGMETLSPALALETFGRLLQQKNGHVAVLRVNWNRILELIPGPVPGFLESVATPAKHTEKQKEKESAVYLKLREMHGDERAQFLESYLKKQIAPLLGSAVGDLSEISNLASAGIDSLMIMDVLNRIRDDLKFMLYPREFYEQPTIQGLARYLAAEFERAHGERGSEAVRVQSVAAVASGGSSFVEVTERPEANHRTSEAGVERLPAVSFILSSPRAGSTLLRVMFAGHPALFSPPELHLLPFSTMKERARLLNKTHLDEGLQRALMELLDLEAEESKTMIESWVTRDLQIREVYAILQQHASPRLLVDKSPSHAVSGEVLSRAERLFQGARYIHLIRHPYSVIESFVRLRMDKLLGSQSKDPYSLAEEIWTTANRNILEVVPRDRYHRVYFEDLVRDPATVATRCCEFLGIPFDESVLRPYDKGRMTDGVHPVSTPIEDPNFLKHDHIDASRGESWRRVDIGRPLSSKTCAVAAELGYDLPNDPQAPISSVTNLPKHEWSGSTAREELPANRLCHQMGREMKEFYLETVRGLRVCICEWGPESGPRVLMLHGILSQGASWVELAERLSDKGLHVMAPDLRGHGRSDHVGRGGSYHLIDFVADLDAIVNKLCVERFVLVGHSMGSVIAALFAAARPDAVASLVMIEPLLPPDSRTVEEADGVRLATQLEYLAAQPSHPNFPDLETAASRMERGMPGLAHSLAVRLAERETVAGESGLQWRWDPLLRTRAGIGFTNDGLSGARYLGLLRGIQAKLTIVLGDESNMRRDDGALFRGNLPGAKTIVLAGGHNVYLEQPMALAEIISETVPSRPGGQGE